MKTRSGFVSNSSSSSFVIAKSALTELQLMMIKNHIEVCKYLSVFMEKTGRIGRWFDVCEGDEWDITETEDSLSGDTTMDNFDMVMFMEQIGVPMGLVEFENGHW